MIEYHPMMVTKIDLESGNETFLFCSIGMDEEGNISPSVYMIKNDADSGIEGFPLKLSERSCHDLGIDFPSYLLYYSDSKKFTRLDEHQFSALVNL